MTCRSFQKEPIVSGIRYPLPASRGAMGMRVDGLHWGIPWPSYFWSFAEWVCSGGSSLNQKCWIFKGRYKSSEKLKFAKLQLLARMPPVARLVGAGLWFH